MSDFSKKEISINQESVSSYIKKIREKNGISLEEASLKTGIKIKYLNAIENSDCKSLPKGSYVEIFLRKYIDFLGIRHKNIVFDFVREINQNQNVEKNIFFNKIISWKNFISFPRILRNFLVFLLVLICFFYLYFYLKNVFAPPFLELYNFQENKIIEESSILIQGKTDKESDVLINNQLIVLNSDGSFSHLVFLNSGVNFITVSAKKKYSQENIIIKQILVER